MEDLIRFFYFALAFYVTIILENVKANSNVNGGYCFAQDTNPYRNFGTSTSYRITFGTADMRIPIDNVCKPAYIYGLMRVGSRYYSRYNVENLRNLQRQILTNHDETNKRGKLCSEDLKRLKSWTEQGNGKKSDDITQQGKIESSELGSRLSKKLKDLGTIGPDNIRFTITSDKTTQETATAFIEGMFGQTANVQISSNENVLRFIENSKTLEDKLTKRAFAMRDTCVNSKHMKTLVTEVSDRLGFTDTLPTKSIEDMYFSCAFETAWAPNEKPGFCASFTKKHLQLLEYCYMDILGYYEWGYGTEHAVKMQSPILNDLLSKMNAAIQSKVAHPKGDFNFASGAALTHTITKLGLYRDKEPLLVSNYRLRKQEQKWSMTQICPFSGNLIAVLHKCGDDEHKVSLYHNENPVLIPGCSSTLCPWSQFRSIIRSNNNQHSRYMKQLKQPVKQLRQVKQVKPKQVKKQSKRESRPKQ